MVYTETELNIIKELLDLLYTYEQISKALYCATGIKRTKQSIGKKVRSMSLHSKSKIITNSKFLSSVNSNITILEKYSSMRSKIKCRCNNCGHTWESITNNLVHKKTGCPLCNNCFNNGAVGYFYCIYFKDLDLFKIGITNNVKRRLTEFGHKSEIIYTRKFNNGIDAQLLEKKYLKNLSKYLYNSGELTTGNTETFKYWRTDE